MVYIGSDHGGFELKEILIKHLTAKGVSLQDKGCFSTESVDYPDIAQDLCKSVMNDKALGILICGTGIGISIAANKVEGIRCALSHNEYTAKMARLHNDANVLALGGRVIGSELAKSIVDIFLETNFESGRHLKRVEKISLIEKG